MRNACSGTSGNLSTPNLRLVQPRGYSPQEGVTLSSDVTATYYWSPVRNITNDSITLFSSWNSYSLISGDIKLTIPADAYVG